ncbi:glycoside hydrolase family 35 protein [Rhizosphaericola mali]|uniref:Beta-galactosidase n=1 Tax=Rhizosphaericola mali TaxID=2545455 RepID=A0A5P2G8G4_9BACT|nr:beta-galactosidase family protein [Rhizosphaericola mali]QES87811.1 beta-galactosidase [Rhizosphaericola mali]
MKKIALVLSTFILYFQSYSQITGKHTFALGDSAFLLDGKPLQMISGEMHYTRIPREAWRDRMQKAKAMGINTIGTYVFWNAQEPEKGQFDFNGNNDIAEFVRIAKEEGLWVILRPSPYVCAEWEFGGYPYWLQNEKGLVVRSKNQQYLEEYKKYIIEVGKQLAPYQVNHGGNILMVQIENEYGSYGSDKEYLDINRKMFLEAGFDGLLFTCDPQDAIANGYLPGLLPAINGVDDPKKVKALINKNHDGKGPYYIAEWYPAWFDWWGTKHHTVPAEKYTPALDAVLGAGISINMYMFHGGTTRDFMNGANFNQSNILTSDPNNHPFEPQISSYDYDAPLDEAGNPTDKYVQFRNVIAKHLPKGVILPAIPVKKPTTIIQNIEWKSNATIFDNLPKPVNNNTPLTFEDLHQAYGFVLYRTKISEIEKGYLKLNELRDYAVIFINGIKIGTLDRRLYQDSLLIDENIKDATLDILVENLGRINFGPFLLKNKKGITQNVTNNGKEINNWQMYSLPFATEPKITNSPTDKEKPILKQGVFMLKAVGDSYLDMSQWGKGIVWINGHNLGRYWKVGPQQTLYVPIEWLKKGKNKITVLELIKPQQTDLEGIDHPILDKLQ